MEKATRDRIRFFNRFYTKTLGVLNRQYLGSQFSLPETRIIQAIYRKPGCSANDIVNSLNIDKSYLSRLLKKFEQNAYITRTTSESDRRKELLQLTADGIKIFHEIDATANKSVDQMCEGLSDMELSELVQSMSRIHELLDRDRNTTDSIEICRFTDNYTDSLIDLALHFQNDGTRPLVSVADQPDILTIEDSYIKSGGNFWIARECATGNLVGSIGIMPYTDEIAVLKKFFVYEPYQGQPYHIGRRLYNELIRFAKANNFKTILLDTPHNTTRAHKFYEKAGFRLIDESDLPVKFSHPYTDCDFFILQL